MLKEKMISKKGIKNINIEYIGSMTKIKFELNYHILIIKMFFIIKVN